MNNPIPVTWQSKTFIQLFFGFVLFTIIGTLTHECGHYFVARYLGYKGGKVHYAYTTIGKTEETIAFAKVWKKYRAEIKTGIDFPGRKEFETEREKLYREKFFIEAGGPLETMLTGTIGLMVLLIYKRKFIVSDYLNFWRWVFILVALFWLRGSFNLIFWIGEYAITHNMSTRGDEFYLSRYMGLGTWTLSIASAIAGVFVLAYITFKIVPIRQRFTFLSAGLSGGLTGAVLWLVILGPRLMP